MKFHTKWIDDYVHAMHPTFFNKLNQDLTVDFEQKFQKKFDGKSFYCEFGKKDYLDKSLPEFGFCKAEIMLIRGMAAVFLVGHIVWYDQNSPEAIRFGADITDKNVVFRFAEISMFDPDILEDIGEERELIDIKAHQKYKTNFPILSNSYNVGQECKLHVSIKKSSVKQLTKYFDKFFIDWNNQNEGEELKWLEYKDYDKEDGVAIYYIDSFRASERYFKLLIENIPSELEIKMIEIVS